MTAPVRTTFPFGSDCVLTRLLLIAEVYRVSRSCQQGKQGIYDHSLVKLICQLMHLQLQWLYGK